MIILIIIIIVVVVVVVVTITIMLVIVVGNIAIIIAIIITMIINLVKGGKVGEADGHNLDVRAEALVYYCLFTLLDLCVSSLRRGHANLLCIVPILTDDPRRESSWRRHWYIISHDAIYYMSCISS